MIKTDNDPDIIDLWTEDAPLPKGRPYNESVVEVDGALFENLDAFVVSVSDHPNNFMISSTATVTGVRVNGLMIEVFYKEDEESEEESIFLDYKYKDMGTLFKYDGRYS